jgi:hypothetical protein
LPAFFGALLALVGAVLTVAGGMFATFRAARFADLGTDAAQFRGELRITAHKRRSPPAGLGTVAIEADTLGHLGHIVLRQARRGTVLARLGTTDASFDA